MIYGCPHCKTGTILLESYQYDRHWFIEFYCLACARVWTPRTLKELWKDYPEETAKRRKRAIAVMLIKESKKIPGHLTDL